MTIEETAHVPPGPAPQTTSPAAQEELLLPPRAREHKRRRGLLALAVLAAAGAGAGATAAATSGSDGTPASSGSGSVSTAAVTRTTLTATQQVSGKLEYAGTYTVAAGGQGGGVLTWLPAIGATIRRGQVLYRANNVAVPLFYGQLPMYRTLQSGVDDGPDNRELERNLVALGYATSSGLTVDDHFTSATATAVKKWQKALGLDQTGVVRVGDVVYLPGALRVTSLGAQVGAPASGAVLQATGTSRIVHVDLDVNAQQYVARGNPVTVTLPQGTELHGHVSSVGTVATTNGNANGNGSSTTVPVDITLDDTTSSGHLDQAPVSVDIVTATARDVLAVPVNALLALQEGGYAVQIVDANGTTRLVPAQLGLFATSLVEVSGDGITEGTKVEVPSE